MSELIREKALEAMEGKEIKTAQFNMGSISIVFEDGTDAILYDQSGIGIQPVVHTND